MSDDEQSTGAATPGGRTPATPRAAFFDVDNTIIRGASIFYMARGLYTRKFITWRDILGFAWQEVSYKTVGENMQHVAEIESKALSFIRGHHVSEMRAIGEEVYDDLLAERIWPGPQQLALDHIAAGEQVWLVTASPIEVAEVIARRLGLTGALGTVAEHVDGIYTGRLVDGIMHGTKKAEAVAALAAREGMDLADCTAYSDSTNDLPMLELVGQPVVVNPDAKLRAHARAHKWPIYDYRTGRKAMRVAVPVAATAGVAAGAALGAMAARRQSRSLPWARR